LPWLPFTLFGVAYATFTKKSLTGTATGRSVSLNVCLSLIYGSLFIIIRRMNGFGNSNLELDITMEDATLDAVIKFLSVVKYTPSLAYLCITMSILHAYIVILLCAEYMMASSRSRMVVRSSNSEQTPLLNGDTMVELTGSSTPFQQMSALLIKVLNTGILNPLFVFGTSPLFFYVFHFVLYKLIGIAIKQAVGGEYANGVSDVGSLLIVWLVGLFIMFWMCRSYGRFKRRQGRSSSWRYF
jgi:hypothetical protein